MSRDSAVKVLVTLAEEQGWEVQVKPDQAVHLKTKSGELIIISANVHERRAIANIRAKLKRNGLIVDPHEWSRIKKEKKRQEAVVDHDHFWTPGQGFVVGGEGGISVTTIEKCSCGDFRQRSDKEIQVDHLIALRRLSHGRILTPEEVKKHQALMTEVDDTSIIERYRASDDPEPPKLFSEIPHPSVQHLTPESVRRVAFLAKQEVERRELRLKLVNGVHPQPESEVEIEVPVEVPKVEEDDFLSQEAAEIEAMLARAKEAERLEDA